MIGEHGVGDGPDNDIGQILVHNGAARDNKMWREDDS
jgi:hypothetical protein